MADSGMNSEHGALFLKIKLSLQIEEVRILNFKFHQLKTSSLNNFVNKECVNKIGKQCTSVGFFDLYH